MPVQSAEAPYHPTTLGELDLPERLVVWSFRRWVSGTENWALVERELHLPRRIGGDTRPLPRPEQFDGSITIR